MKKLSALIALSLFAAPAVYAAPGGSCAESIPLSSGATVNADTTGATNWMTSFGPLVSPSNDLSYTFTASNPAPTGSITPTASSYSFALYLIAACSDTGTEGTPIGATGTVGVGINLTTTTSPIVAGAPYWVVVTGAAAGGPGANGTLTFTTPDPLPVTLQEFQIN